MKEHIGSFNYACKCIYIHQEDTSDINIYVYTLIMLVMLLDLFPKRGYLYCTYVANDNFKI